ncbi:MAG: DUF962 domain-containing protein [Planctomycetota bacterium]|nr:DUF962 domain-containing protein [Planctomycetota bacterium]MDA1178998.1 DUF962 domain-containing protein [Planctomycetota bacterium]
MTFREFYPHYLAAHRHPLNRAIHYIGAMTALASFVAAVVVGRPAIFVVAVVSVYSILWLSHLLVEHNTPLTLKGGWRMVVMSMCGEFYMTWRFLTRRMRSDLERFGLNR